MTNAPVERFRLTDRIERIRDAAAARAREPAPLRHRQNRTKAFFQLYRDLPTRERHARALAYALANEPVLVFPGERINGVFYGGWDPGASDSDAVWRDYAASARAHERSFAEVPDYPEIFGRHLPPEQRTALLTEGVPPGHVAWNYRLILAEGVGGLIRRHRESAESTADPLARQYCGNVIVCLEAMLEWNRRHVDRLKTMLAEETDPIQRELLERNIAIMRRVPARPARNFHEALQSFYFQWLCVMYENPYGGNSPGRLDYFLWPYLETEFRRGRLTYQDAAELLAELFIKIDERVHFSDGHVNTIVVGGIRPDGTDAVNPLSYMMLDVFEALQITHPAVYTRLSNVNPVAWFNRSVEYLLEGGNRAQILNDDAIVAAMTKDGRMPASDAAMYICGGCMEINPHGMNSDLLFSFTFNVPKVLELVVTGGEDLLTGQRRLDLTTALPDFHSFEQLYQAFLVQMERILTAKFRSLDIYSEEWARNRPAYLLSSMIDDCLIKGREQQDGGARYSDYGGTPLGIQNAADTLYALKTAVFDEKFCTPRELLQALKDDFAGHEVLHRRLLAVPKYGAGHEPADRMMNRLLRSVCDIFHRYRNRHGRPVKPIVFTFVWAPEIGATLGASADGRRARRPIGHGLTPQAFGMRQGLTAAINSCTALDAACVSGGASTMWDLDPAWVNLSILKGVVAAFLRKKGQIFQGNTTDVADLKKALDRPEEYPNLIVRVGGFSARFIHLNRALQMEIIERVRHAG
ncbi:MAG: hypothetical protein GXP31_14845 [Kiritimatiellaeota bacterium]|nr:hypothetical protein [Kiritimatiellota bacterium]